MFGTRVANSMYAALYGDLAPHAPLAEFSQDAYSLFYARSAAMGWLTPSVEGASGGLWAMNDAGAGVDSGPQPLRVAWFQVTLTEPLPAGVLPVQPFLSCAGAVLARLGTLRLEAVQMHLPGQGAPIGGDVASPSRLRVATPLLSTLNWFGDCDPKLRAPARITLDGGADPSIRTAAPAVAQWVQEVHQNVFVYDSFSMADSDHLALRPTPRDKRLGTSHHQVTFRGMLAEWSLDALGWLAAFLADVCARQGISTPLMLTADRAAAPGSPAR